MIDETTKGTETKETTMNDLLGEYTEQEIAAAFKRVENPEHWKGAIDAVVLTTSKEEVDEILFAVAFYTGTEATAELVRGPSGLAEVVRAGGGLCTYRIKAAGYWAGPAN